MKTVLVLAFAMLGISAAAAAATRVSSDSSCPSSDAISLRLLGLLAAGGPESASATVRCDGQSMRIEVTTPGEIKQQRTVPLVGDCEERAEMAALIIASWLDAMPVGTIRTPGIPPRERRGGSTSSGYSDPSDDPNWEPLKTSSRALVGAGVLGLADAQGLDPGLVLNAGMPELIEDFGFLVEASMGLYRDVAVGVGSARYWRPTFTVQASADVYRRRWALRALAGPALGILMVNGSGYPKNLSDTTVMWGVDFGLVLARAWPKHAAWLSCGGIAWPQGRTLRSRPDVPNSQTPLPEWEARLALGISWEIHGSEK